MNIRPMLEKFGMVCLACIEKKVWPQKVNIHGKGDGLLFHCFNCDAEETLSFLDETPDTPTTKEDLEATVRIKKGGLN